MKETRFPKDVDLIPVGVEAAKQFAGEWAAAAAGVPGDPHGLRVNSCKQGWGDLKSNKAVHGDGPLTIAGKTFASGLGTHAESEIVLRTHQSARVLRAWVGMNDTPGARGAEPNKGSPARLIFSVEAGGRELWRSAAMGIDTPAVRVDVALNGATDIVLRVRDVNGNNDWAHANWVEIEVVLADGHVAGIGKYAGEILPGQTPPFSFRLGGRASAELLGAWQVTRAEKPGGAGVKVQVVTWRDPQSGLECEMEQQTFAGFPAVEWVLRFRNTGKTDTPLIEDIRPLDIDWAADKDRTWNMDDTFLRRSRGSPCTPGDFEYLVAPLPVGETIRMAAGGGRSSNAWLPFFNLQSGKKGVMVGIGWSGQWAAEFARENDSAVRVRVGQELTRLKLHPGEEIRTPRIALLFWDGEPQASHNTWRRFVLAHHVPKAEDGQPVMGPVCAATWGGMESAHHLEQIADIRKHKLDYDYYWIDAGWYGPAGSFSPDVYTGEWAKYVGHWNINPRAHPNGLKPLADAAHAAGLKFLLWFEPERALTDTPWTIEYPEWFLGERKPGASLLYNLGNPEARRFLTDFISNMIRDVGIDCYRQDFNIDPLPYWRAADAPDRQGISEIRYVEGHYEFWDELLRRHPGLLIDNCASGGRRIDLETVSRSIPLWRSDYQCFPGFDPAGCQVQTHGLSYWLPVHGGGTCGGQHDPRRGDTYHVRSNLSASLEFPIYFNQGDGVPDHPWDWQRRMIEEYKRARPLFYGDYYPLTAGTPASDVWLVMQYHRPDLGEGLLLAFRRKDAPFISAAFRLQGLDPGAEYDLQDADTGKTWKQSGKELGERGVRVEMEQAPESRLVFYRKQ
jgi:alpha-galactosidase